MKRIIEPLLNGVTGQDGALLDGGFVHFYEAGTTTRLTVFKDFDLEEPHANPATLDSAGRLVAYSDARLRLVIEDSARSVIHTWDHLGTSDSDIELAVNTQILGGNGLILDGTGALNVEVDGSTITTIEGQIAVAPGGVTGSHIADDTITGDNLIAAPVIETSLQIGAGGPVLTAVGTTLQVNGALNLSGTTLDLKALGTKSLQVKDHTAVVSENPATNGLKIVRGRVDGAGTKLVGEGFTSARPGAGRCTITFSAAFLDVPSASVSVETYAQTCIRVEHYTTKLEIYFTPVGGGTVDQTFSFIAIGQRA